MTLLLALPLAALAFQTATCGWEGTETILGNYGDIIASIETTTPIYNGSQSLNSSMMLPLEHHRLS